MLTGGDPRRSMRACERKVSEAPLRRHKQTVEVNEMAGSAGIWTFEEGESELLCGFSKVSLWGCSWLWL